MCVSLFADIILRSSDIDLEFVKMLQHPSGPIAGGSSHNQRTILTASDGTNHVVYNLHTMSPTSNIISCDSIEEATVTPITPSHAEIAVRSSLDDDLNEYVICEKADPDSKSPGSSYSVVVVANTSSGISQHSSALNISNTMQGTAIASPVITVASTVAPTTTGRAKGGASAATAANNGDRQKFYCPKCGSQFTALRNMKRHFHHECGIEPKHVCEHCPMRFKRRNLLKYHMVRKHPPKTEKT